MKSNRQVLVSRCPFSDHLFLCFFYLICSVPFLSVSLSSGVISGAITSQYLLEKSRIVFQVRHADIHIKDDVPCFHPKYSELYVQDRLDVWRLGKSICWHMKEQQLPFMSFIHATIQQLWWCYCCNSCDVVCFHLQVHVHQNGCSNKMPHPSTNQNHSTLHASPSKIWADCLKLTEFLQRLPVSQEDSCGGNAVLYFSVCQNVKLLFPLQAKDERNYHIFYEMLAGLPSQQKQAFYLQEAETYYYLNQVEQQSAAWSWVFSGLWVAFCGDTVHIWKCLFLHAGRGLWDNRKEWCRWLPASACCHGDPPLHPWRPVGHL